MTTRTIDRRAGRDVLRRRWTMVGDRVIHSRETSDAARPNARPLVLLHGVGTTSRYFRPLLRELAGNVPATAPELPGIGSSSSESLPVDVAGQADVVAEWLLTTGRQPRAVVGNSMGAQVAVELAIRHPALVDRLVLIGPTVDAAARGPLAQGGRLLLDVTRERPSMLAIAVTDSFLTRRRAVLLYARAALDHHLESRLPLVVVPVLILRGERDPLVSRAWAQRLATVAPLGQVIEVAGAAHACHHGRPARVAELLTSRPLAAPRR